MSKFCQFCGSSIPEGIAFCPNCGARIDNAQPAVAPVAAPAAAPQPQYAPQQPQYAAPAYPYPQFETTPPPKKKKYGKIIAIILVVLAVLLIGVIVLAVLGSSVEDYQEPIEAWAEALEKDDVDKMYDAYFDAWDEIGFSEKTVKQEFQVMIDSFREDVEDDLDSDDFEISVEYDEKRKYDDDDIEELHDTLKAANIDNIEIEEAYEVEATIQAEADGDWWETDQYTFVVIKVDGKWSIYQIRGLPI